jgi:hypothetical protein
VCVCVCVCVCVYAFLRRCVCVCVHPGVCMLLGNVVICYIHCPSAVLA